MDADGDLVIAWTSIGQNAGASGIYAQRYGTTGVAQGTEFRVNTLTSESFLSSVGINANGEFLVTWSESSSLGGFIRARRFDSAGGPLASEFRVDSADFGQPPGATMSADGNFVVACPSSGGRITAHRYIAFGPASAATVGDRVWNDANANGIQDTGEAGISGAVVELYSASGGAVAAATTNSAGNYSFVGLAGAGAFMRVVTPAGFITTRQDQGIDDDLDSDVDRSTGLTATLTIGAGGSTNNSIDAGFTLPASIAGVVFYDRNADGVRNGAEEAMPGFQVFLDLDADGMPDASEPTTFSSPTGYSFGGMLGDSYRVVVANQDEWIEPALAPLVATAGSSNQLNLPVRTLAPDTSRQPDGPEFRVNSFTTGQQGKPSIAAEDNGDLVVTWASFGQDGDGQGVYAQRYTAAGAKLGGEFRVNTYTSSYQYDPSSAMDADGDFVIAWTSTDQDGSYYGVYAQRYNAAGIAQGSEFQVNTYTDNGQGHSSVAMDAGGNFVITWMSYLQDGSLGGIYAQRFNAAGVKQGIEFRVNTDVALNESQPTVAMDPDGDFVVAWTSGYNGYYTSTPYDIRAQRYNAAGVAQGGEIAVTTGPTSEIAPSIAMDEAGDFVIAWQGYGDGSDTSIQARRYNAVGVPQGAAVGVNTLAAGLQLAPAVAMESNGGFLVSWSDSNGSVPGIHGQRYNAAGVTQGANFKINSFALGSQSAPAAAMSADGNFVVVWQSEGQDGSNGGVYAQRYTEFGVVETAAFGDRVWKDVNGNGIQDNGEPGLAGVMVELYNSDGVLAAFTTTDVSGNYGFPIFSGSSVYLHFATPVGFLPARANIGGDDNVDSDADRITGLTPIFMAGPGGSSNSGIDAGFVVPSSIVGVVYFDRNSNGVRDGGEEGVPGFGIYLDLDNDGVLDAGEPSFGSNADGTYSFDRLLDGTYQLVVTGQELWVEPSISPVALPVGTATTRDVAVRTPAHDTASTAQGNEFRVNTDTNSQFDKREPSVAADAVGNFVVVWASDRQDGNGYGVYAQRYNAAGTKQGNEFRVNSTTNNHQLAPAIAMDADGDFVIAWESFGQDGSESAIYAQRYNAGGSKQGNAFRVNTFTTGSQSEPSIAIESGGDFVVAWSSYGQDGDGAGIYAQRYNAAGTKQGNEFRVNTHTAGPQGYPSAAMDSDGDFVIAWNGEGLAGGGAYARRFNLAGVAQGNEFSVSADLIVIYYYTPSVAMDAAGNFVIAFAGITPGTSQTQVRAQRFNAVGSAQGTNFTVNSSPASNSSGAVAAAMDADGDSVITWDRRADSSNDGGVYAQRYNLAGVPQGGEFRVNSDTTLTQFDPAVAMAANGNFVVSWTTYFGDPFEVDIHARRFSVAARPAVIASQFVWNGGVQRIEFTFDQDVSASLSSADLVLQNLTTSTTISTASIVRTWNGATRTATFTFPTLPNGASLPDGDYRATLGAAGVSNAAGTALVSDYAISFFVLAGDANRDRVVDIGDFAALGAHYNRVGVFGDGDFNYSGVVEIGDFAILASKFNTSLPAARSATAGMPPATLSYKSAAAARRSTFGTVRIYLDELDIVMPNLEA